MPCFRDYVFKAMLGEWIDVWMKNQFAFFFLIPFLKWNRWLNNLLVIRVCQSSEKFCFGIKDRDIWKSKE